MFRRLQLYRWRPYSAHTYRVIALDGSTLTYELETRAKGAELLQLVLKDLSISEGDYFGLFQSENKQWLILNKGLRKQLRGNGPHLLNFGVEVYPKDHNDLLSPTTRYQIYLQAKTDLESRSLACSHEIEARLQTLITDEARCAAMISDSAEEQHHLGDTKGRSSDDYAREYLEVAQLEDTFGTFVYAVLDSSHRPLSLSLGPGGVCIVGGTRVEWDSVSKVSSFGRHLTICSVHTMEETQATPIFVTFSSSSLCCSVAAHCLRLRSQYSDLACENTKTKLKRFLSLRLGRDATGKQSVRSPRPATLKKATSFSIRFQSFRNRRTILAGHSLESIVQPPCPSFAYQQPTQQPRSMSPSHCLSLSLTPPLSPTPPPCSLLGSSYHVVDVASSTDSCTNMPGPGVYCPTPTGCVYTAPQLCADSSTREYTADSIPSEVGNLDAVLQTLEEKLKEQRCPVHCEQQEHRSVATRSRRKRSTSATDIYCVKAKHGSGYIKNHLSSVELDHFSPPTIMDPHVRSLVFEACQSSALGTEL